MKSIQKRVGLITGAAATACVLLAGGPAYASSDVVENLASAGPNTACWVNETTGESACAPSQEELAVAVLEEFNTVFTGEMPAAFDTADVVRANSLQPRATAIFGIIYDGANFTGKSVTHSGDVSNPCPAPQDYLYGQVNYLMFWGWENMVSSFQGYNTCALQLFADNEFKGSSYGPSKYAPNLGAFDNQASSMRVRFGG